MLPLFLTFAIGKPLPGSPLPAYQEPMIFVSPTSNAGKRLPPTVGTGPWRVNVVCGDKKGVCIVDTGSPFSYFKPEILRNLPKPKEGGSFADASGPLTLPNVQWSKTYFHTASRRMVATLDSLHVDGVIGLDLLKYLAIVWTHGGTCFDFQIPRYEKVGDLLALAGPASAATGVEIGPLDLNGETAYISALVNNVPGYFAVDTGLSFGMFEPDFAAKASIRPSSPVKLQLLEGETRADRAGSAVSVQLGRGVSFLAKALIAPRAIDYRGSDGVLGCGIANGADFTALDLHDGVFAARVSLPRELESQTEVSEYPMLPGSSGPLIVSPSKKKGQLRVFCPSTKAVFEVPSDSPMPSFLSIRKALRRSNDYPNELVGLVLGPGQSSPSGWFAIIHTTGLAVAYAPGGRLYVPEGATTSAVGELKKLAPGVGSVLTPKDLPSSEGPSSGPESVIVATPPGNHPLKFESDTPVELPADWSIAFPSSWAISSNRPGSILLTPRGTTAKTSVGPPPFWKIEPDYHLRFYSGVGWTEVPD